MKTFVISLLFTFPLVVVVSSVHPVTEIPSSTLRSSSVIINLCESSSSALSGVKEIPVLFTSEQTRHNITYTFKLVDSSLEKNTTVKTCNTNESSSQGLFTTSLSVTDYNALLQSGNSQESIWRNSTLLWNSGHLSVGAKHEEHVMTYYYSSDEFCLQTITGTGNNTKLIFNIICNNFAEERTILTKCCPFGQILSSEETVGCVVYPELKSFQPEFFDKEKHQLVSYSIVNPVIRYASLNSCSGFEQWLNDGCGEQHPALDGSLAFIGTGRDWGFLQHGYCFDQILHLGSVRYGAAVCTEVSAAKSTGGRPNFSWVYLVCMYVGTFFHFLTSSILGLTWSRQNIPGQLTFYLTLSLFGTKLMMGNAHLIGLTGLVELNTNVCIANGILAQFFTIACFNWLLIVNFDMWLVFRSKVGRRLFATEQFKLLLAYNSVGWGLPLVICVISIILNFQFPCPSSMITVPDYGKQICFVDPSAEGMYIYYILGILMIFTCLLAGLTMMAIASVKFQPVVVVQREDSTRSTIILLFKLVMVMGLTSIFEIIGWVATQDEDEYNVWLMIFDVCNAGLEIFIFKGFVCNKKIVAMLELAPIFYYVTEAIDKLPPIFSRRTEDASSRRVVGTTSDEGVVIMPTRAETQF